MQNKCIHCRLPGAVFGTAAVQHAARRCSAAAAQQLVAVLACQTCQPACYRLPVRDLYCFRQFKKTLHLVGNASARTGTSQTCLVDRQAEARPSKQMAVETLARHCLPIKKLQLQHKFKVYFWLLEHSAACERVLRISEMHKFNPPSTHAPPSRQNTINFK